MATDKVAKDPLLPLVSMIGNEQTSKDITSTYLEFNRLIDDLENIQQTVIAKHQEKFTADYKEHMLKVQVQLFDFKKKASDYYQSLMKDEKFKNLEASVTWLRNESIRLAGSIDRLTE